jgi:HlyD family secretion protein
MSWVRSHPILSAIFLLLLVGGLAAVIAGQRNGVEYTTATVERGTVSEVVSVSGAVEATREATLSFPTSGIITAIVAERGSEVVTGDILATIGDAAVAAERAQAAAAVRAAAANREELVNGQTAESAEVTETTIENAEAALAQTQAVAREQVSTALAALLSNDLEALAIDGDELAAAPTITGTYTCTETGSYTIDVFQTDTRSGFSYRLSGLESGTFPATASQPAPLGTCGLFIQFVDGEPYARSQWTVSVPNTRSATYVTRQNAYTLAVTQAEQNVQAARDALTLATNQASVATAAPRVEALVAATAALQEAQARLQAIDARLADFSITAPFDGVVTDVFVNPGEVANLQPAMSLLNTDEFELIARIPEIDVTKLAVGQAVQATFDAKQDEVVTGTITFIAPEAVEIDGVGYFEAVIILDPTPEWLRAGLNADIDITVTALADVARLPQRFVDQTGNSPTVQILDGDTVLTQPVELGFTGNDGYVEVRNFPVGTQVIVP